VASTHEPGGGAAGGTRPEPFAAVDLIVAKRDGGTLSGPQLAWLVDAYLRGVVAEEQMAAWLMAVCLRGLDDDETAALTGAYVRSGRRLDWSGLGRPVVDKHSTGGVGDKVTLVLNPLLASLGAAVPQLAGRGLGRTGGTLDKLEAIAGFRTTLDDETLTRQVAAIGTAVCAASDTLAPADRRLYALRDVTGTVESVPLIAASILSKKLAEGTAALVLDVKVGSGALLRRREDARELAGRMVRLGAANCVPVRALLTDMDTPLGLSAGNAVEVAEALDVLHGRGPADVTELVVRLGVEMAVLAGLDPAEVPRALADGRALAVWRQLVTAQGGDPDAPLPGPAVRAVIPAPRSGVLTRLDAGAVGAAAWRLGAGRARKEDPVDPAAGVRWFHRPGDPVVAGEPLFELHTADPARLDGAREALGAGFVIGDDAPRPVPLVLETIG
jgi:thymidine phosphorylase